MKIIEDKNGRRVFDPTRKKYVALTPEEYVRQVFVEYLVGEKGYPLVNIKTEYELKFNNLSRRADIVIFNKGKILMIVECKAQKVQLDAKVLEQIWQYNYVLGAKYLTVTNLRRVFVCKVTEKGCDFLREFPSWDEIS